MQRSKCKPVGCFANNKTQQCLKCNDFSRLVESLFPFCLFVTKMPMVAIVCTFLGGRKEKKRKEKKRKEKKRQENLIAKNQFTKYQRPHGIGFVRRADWSPK
jgi:hypothetical protein